MAVPTQMSIGRCERWRWWPRRQGRKRRVRWPRATPVAAARGVPAAGPWERRHGRHRRDRANGRHRRSNGWHRRHHGRPRRRKRRRWRRDRRYWRWRCDERRGWHRRRRRKGRRDGRCWWWCRWRQWWWRPAGPAGLAAPVARAERVERAARAGRVAAAGDERRDRRRGRRRREQAAWRNRRRGRNGRRRRNRRRWRNRGRHQRLFLRARPVRASSAFAGRAGHRIDRVGRLRGEHAAGHLALARGGGQPRSVSRPCSSTRPRKGGTRSRGEHIHRRRDQHRGLSTIDRATIAIYGRSDNTTTSGSFTWQTPPGPVPRPPTSSPIRRLTAGTAPTRPPRSDPASSDGADPGARGPIIQCARRQPRRDLLRLERVSQICKPRTRQATA